MCVCECVCLCVCAEGQYDADEFRAFRDKAVIEVRSAAQRQRRALLRPARPTRACVQLALEFARRGEAVAVDYLMQYHGAQVCRSVARSSDRRKWDFAFGSRRGRAPQFRPALSAVQHFA